MKTTYSGNSHLVLWSASSLLGGEVSEGFGLVTGTNSDFLLDLAGNIESKFKSETSSLSVLTIS